MMKGSSAARKRTTTGGSGSDNTSSSSAAAAAAEEGYHHCAEEECITTTRSSSTNNYNIFSSLLLHQLAHPTAAATTPPELARDDNDDYDDDLSLEHDKRPRPIIISGGNFLMLLLCNPITFWRHHFRRRRRRRGWKNYTRSEKCILLCWVLAATLLMVDRVIFVVRYVTMGRPAVLYGSPMEWDNVKGCLSTSWRQEVANYVKVAAESAEMAASATNHPNYHVVPLNTNLKWTWHQQASSSSSSSQHGGAVADDATDGNNINTTTNRVARRRLLIAQYSGFGSYSQILNEVAPVNQAYAKAWGHDYATLEGTALRFPGLRYNNNGNDDGDDTQDDEEKGGSDDHDVEGDHDAVVDDNAAVLAASCPNLENGYEAQSTFNKIPLLLEALEHAASTTAQTDATAKVGGGSDDGFAYYDQVLILDTDTMIVDFDYDITTLLLRNNNKNKNNNNNNDGEEYFMAAYRVWSMDWHWTWDINAGITLWNLNHPTTRQVAHIWLQRALTHPHEVLLKNDDQFFLQRALMSVGWWKRMWYGVRTVREEMEYYDATLIKHFKRDARSWTRTSLEQRLLRIQEAKAAVCERWTMECRSTENLSGDSN